MPVGHAHFSASTVATVNRRRLREREKSCKKDKKMSETEVEDSENNAECEGDITT